MFCRILPEQCSSDVRYVEGDGMNVRAHQSRALVKLMLLRTSCEGCAHYARGVDPVLYERPRNQNSDESTHTR